MQPDRMQRPNPDAIQLNGLLGRRLDLSRQNRLHHQEEEHLLWPFQQGCPVGFMLPNRPYPEIRGDWQGEFLGTWLDAACLSAWNAGDNFLRRKVVHMADAWMDTQKEDGYLGTYNQEERWQSWDIWIHAHSIVGLLSYYHYTRDKRALQTALRAMDCILTEFGPGRRSVNSTGPHGGMASSAILEPAVWLFTESGDERYLRFARWLVDVDWETASGPRIVSSLLSGKGVAGTANGKGIEMLMDFFGLVELYRATGEVRYLDTVLTAWEDIVRHQLYITGSASTGEHFRTDYLLQNDGMYMVGETCVSMGWMYLNFSLGRLTGEVRFFDMAEQTIYNHLLAAQSPDGRGWAYYTGLRDSKRYRWHTDPECCPSKGVRALAHIPQHVLTLVEDGLAVNFYESCSAHVKISSGYEVRVKVVGDYPFDGRVTIQVDPERSAAFSIRLRLPGWCRDCRLAVNSTPNPVELDKKGYIVLMRTWQQGDVITLDLQMPVHAATDRIGNLGKIALTRGPLVYALDQALLPPGLLLDEVVLGLQRTDPAARIGIKTDPETGSVFLESQRLIPQTVFGPVLWRELLRYHDLSGSEATDLQEPVSLVPFFEAGNLDPRNYKDGIHENSERQSHISYQVWLPYRLV